MSSTLIVQLDMRTLCQEADVTAECVIEIVEHGIVEPSGRTPEDWLFDDQALPVELRPRCWTVGARLPQLEFCKPQDSGR